jgi:hypothetical protein
MLGPVDHETKGRIDYGAVPKEQQNMACMKPKADSLMARLQLFLRPINNEFLCGAAIYSPKQTTVALQQYCRRTLHIMLRSKYLARTLVGLLVGLLIGCARVAFYSDPEFEHKITGVKFYTPKPYLLIARTGAKDKPVDISIVYLPDLANPSYARPIAGLGSSDLAMSFTNGMLSSYGEKTDSKIPELISALGSFTGSAAQAAKTFAAQAGVVYTAQGQRLQGIADDLRIQLDQARKKEILTLGELQTGEAIQQTLAQSGEMLLGPEASSNLLTVIANLKQALSDWSQIRAPSTTLSSEQSVLANLAADKEQTALLLDELVKWSSAPSESAPSFSLYAIDNTSGNTILTPVISHETAK